MDSDQVLEVPFGCTERETNNGATYLRIHYSADPGKRYSPEIVALKREELGPRMWDREMEMDEEVFDGQPVYESYDNDYHCPLAIRESNVGGIELAKALTRLGSRYFGGWDTGASTLAPAFVLFQVTPNAVPDHGAARDREG
jgi:hypothetical protein